MEARNLHGLLAQSARRDPGAVAVVDPGVNELTYDEVDRLSDRVRDRLRACGVNPGDRVGLYIRKSVDSIAILFGALKAGAAYVPVDPDAPAERCAYILDNCAVRVIITESRLERALTTELNRLGSKPVIIALEETADRATPPLQVALDRCDAITPATSRSSHSSTSADLAYILYTSGSTGRPKGVMLTHGNALSFVDWCSETFEPVTSDVFSSHAPLHFDLSILDVYVPIKHGARIVLIGEELGKDPLALAPLIVEQGITMWYSTPSILSLMANYGKLERFRFDGLRVVNFAGEVFPIPQLKAIKAWWTAPRFFNLYGPTETNVCTYQEIPREIPETQTEAFPIGRICQPNRGRVVDLDGRDVAKGEIGELVVNGPNVMVGYWNLPENNARAFLMDDSGERWYHTGDLVVETDDGVYIYRGRRDRMVKRRGYRVELGEIEAALARHPAIRESAVVAVEDGSAGIRVRAYFSARNGDRPSIIALKQFCSEHLPRYMIPDTFGLLESLPRTSTDKIDYQRLKTLT